MQDMCCKSNVSHEGNIYFQSITNVIRMADSATFNISNLGVEYYKIILCAVLSSINQANGLYLQDMFKNTG